MSDFNLHRLGGAEQHNAVADVVFIHGLGGDAIKTWGEPDATPATFWPEFLIADFPGAQIWSLDHPAGKLKSIWTGEGMDLLARSAAALEAMAARGIGSRPLIFITHSLGGLVAKCILRKSKDSGESQKAKIFQSTIGAIFIATPHNGADLADTLTKIPFIRDLCSASVKDLKASSSSLQDLNDWYRNVVDHNALKTKAYAETKKIAGKMIVPLSSANPAVPGCDVVPVDRDHINICKIPTAEDELYVSIQDFIRRITSSNNIDLSSPGEIDSLAFYTNKAPDDRLSLEQKLERSGRTDEIPQAVVEKERIAKMIARDALSGSARALYGRVLGDILSRFNVNVRPSVRSGKSNEDINQLFQDRVLDPVVKSLGEVNLPLNSQVDVHAATYFLTGKCHVDWKSSDG